MQISGVRYKRFTAENEALEFISSNSKVKDDKRNSFISKRKHIDTMDDSSSPLKTSKIDSISLYTDGSCLKNPGKGGWAAFVQKISNGEIIDEYQCSGREENTTNNRMELKGAEAGLQSLSSTISGSEVPISIYTDSKYLKDGITGWIFNWKKNKWFTSKGKKVKNSDLWKEIDTLCKNKNITWNWVKAHAGHKQNEFVDKLARKEAKNLVLN